MTGTTGSTADRYLVHLVAREVPWENSGRTDLDNAISLGRRRQRLIHWTFEVQSDPNGEIRSYTGSVCIGSTYPAQRHLLDLGRCG